IASSAAPVEPPDKITTTALRVGIDDTRLGLLKAGKLLSVLACEGDPLLYEAAMHTCIAHHHPLPNAEHLFPSRLVCDLEKHRRAVRIRRDAFDEVRAPAREAFHVEYL